MAKTISLRIEDEITSKIDVIAKIEDRDRSYIINKAITEYLETYNWQLQQIEEGLKQIEQGEVLSEEEGKAIFMKLRKELQAKL